jgi:hypothetical protein
LNEIYCAKTNGGKTGQQQTKRTAAAEQALALSGTLLKQRRAFVTVVAVASINLNE